MRQIILIVHNLRSAHNVGSLLRTADGLGIQKVYLTGYTPHPPYDNDNRMPHEAAKVAKLIHKTALGAEDTVKWQYCPDITNVIDRLKADDISICALEQSSDSVQLQNYIPGDKVALILGNEITGVDAAILKAVDTIVEIPMQGKKESFNVAQAAGMALYHLRFNAK